MSTNEKPEFKLEMKPGESLDDAIARIAAALPQTMIEQEPAKEKKPAKITVSDPNVGQPVDGNVFEAVHIYQRSNPETGERESEGTVRSNATRERKMFGPNVLVFQHLHSFGEACNPACREKVQ